MTKLVFILTFFFSYITSFGQQNFFYNLTTSLPKDSQVTKLYISYDVAGVKYKDSLDLSKKQFSFKKNLLQPVDATLYTNNTNIEPLSVMLANNNLVVAINEKTLTVSPSKVQTDFLYLTENDRIRPSYFPLYGELTEKNDTVGLKKLSVIFERLKNDDIEKSLKYFKANKNSILSLFSFKRFTSFFADYSKVEKEFSLLPTWAKNSPEGKVIREKIKGSKSSQLNTQAKTFEQLSSTGQKISLDLFKDKYILLDFWASWCSPCRKEHPALIKIYQAFKNKNFEIISISLDSENERWLNAIAKDKISWTQISDLKGQQNEIAIKYGVQSVPANFLINPQGIIIGKNLTTEELNNTLQTILK